MVKYFEIDSYSMKCRLYPNKSQGKRMNEILEAIRIIWNKSLYDMKENGLWSKEKPDKKNEGQVVRFPDFNSLKKAENYNQYITQDSRLKIIPKASLSSKANSIYDAMKKAWEITGKYPIEKWGKYTSPDGETEWHGVRYVGSRNPVSSFFFQSSSMKTIPDEKGGYKRNVFRLIVPNIRRGKPGDEDYVSGEVKVRGWNQKLRFDDDKDFLQWIQTKPQVSVRVTKDKCGDWYAVFNFVSCRKPMDVAESGAIGVDVGEKTLVTLDDGTKYKSVFDYCPEMKKMERTSEYYNRKLCRSEGWKNIIFRERRKEDPTLQPSKTYTNYDLRQKKLERKKTRVRKNYYHNVTADLLRRGSIIGVEGLKVGDMVWLKE